MRFCQSDGTPLVDDAPPVDPYKTMVASSGDIAAAMPPAADPPKQDDEVLQLPPEADPKKTMYASEEEIRKEMQSVDEQVVDLPPLTPEPPAAPEPPKFSEPSLSPPSFGEGAPASTAPPPSPFSPSAGEPKSEFGGDPFAKTTPPIPSPFDKPKPSTYEPPPSPNFSAVSDPEPAFKPSSSSGPLGSAPPGASPAAPIQNWEKNEPMQNAPYSSAPAVAGQNKTLAIISLVTGILSLFCCAWFVPGIAAVVMGFMAKSKAAKDPANYGGGGLALGAIISGAVSILLGIIVSVLYLMGFLTGLINPNAF